MHSITALLPLCISIFTFYVACLTHAKEVYVSRSLGNDGHSGTAAAPVATLMRGVQLLSAGDTLIIAPESEPYYESLSFGSKSGTARAPIVVEGNGACLSGLEAMPPNQWQDQGNGTWHHPHKQSGSLRPYLMDGERPLPIAESVAALTPDSHCWTTEGVWFMPATGKTLTDYQLLGTLKVSGVIINHGSYIRVRNLTCERFANDGFNVHGGSRGLVFDNIVGRFNGDDGFSIHEDVDAIVYGGYFHHNDFGIQDINASQSVFHDVLVESNRIAGVDLHGGFRSLFDSTIRDNAGHQIAISKDSATQLSFAADNPLCQGLVYLKNVIIENGATGIKINAGSALVASGCTLRNLITPVNAAMTGELWTITPADGPTATQALPYLESFESFNAGDTWPPTGDTSWHLDVEDGGYAAITADPTLLHALTNTYVGHLPLRTTHHKVLQVSNTVATLAVTNSGTKLVESIMMLQAKRYQADEVPTIDDTSRLSVFFDATGKLSLLHAAYVGTTFTNCALTLTASPVIPHDAWVRLTITCDYTHKMFQVRLNEAPPIEDATGWSMPAGTQPGAWFYMINRDAGGMASLQISHQGFVDDLWIREHPATGTLLLVD